jgi:AraC-like DNA-binding protein
LRDPHFARQFRTATGLSPHQDIILRRVERVKQLLQRGGDLSLAEITAHAGFADQSGSCRHFKRLVGVMPGQLQMPARIAEPAASPCKNPDGDPLTIAHEPDGAAWSLRGRRRLDFDPCPGPDH